MRSSTLRWMTDTGGPFARSARWMTTAATIGGLALLIGLPGCGGDEEIPPPSDKSVEVEPPGEQDEAPAAEDAAMPTASPEGDSPAAAEPDESADAMGADKDEAVADAAKAVETVGLDEAIEQWDGLLGAIVTVDGLVDYNRLRESAQRETLERVVASLGEAELPSGDDARLAMLINAYNANVLKRVLETWEGGSDYSVSQVPGFFDERPVRVAGQILTLDRLVNNRVRPFNDPRIHAALAGGAMSSPPLRSGAYRAAGLSMQLDDQSRRWVNDPAQFYVEDDALYASEIMKWYGEDFQRPPFSGVLGFISAYADPGGAASRHILLNDNVDLRWAPFDWSLNSGDVME